jgi:predicted RNA binding protein YcfA (HicA-like mRNA interferase family)
MKYSEVERKLKSAGCRLLKNGKRHPIWYSPITELIFELSYHTGQEVKPGTLKSISKASGVEF